MQLQTPPEARPVGSVRTGSGQGFQLLRAGDGL